MGWWSQVVLKTVVGEKKQVYRDRSMDTLLNVGERTSPWSFNENFRLG